MAFKVHLRRWRKSCQNNPAKNAALGSVLGGRGKSIAGPLARGKLHYSGGSIDKLSVWWRSGVVRRRIQRKRRAAKGVVEPCHYCGIPATTIDHTTPRALLSRMKDLEPELLAVLWDNLPTVLVVPSCQQCNSILGAGLFATLADRKKHVKKRLREKYSRLLRSPDWSESDYEDMGYALTDFVRNRQNLKKLIRQRIAW